MAELVQKFLERGVLIEAAALEIITERKIPAEKLERLFPNSGLLTKEALEAALLGGPRSEPRRSLVVVEKCYKGSGSPKDLGAFVELFNRRYEKLKALLSGRPELRAALSIGRVGANGNRDVAVIGIVSDIGKSKAGNTIVELEDPTGKIPVLFRGDQDLGQQRIFLDDVIGVRGKQGRGYLFADAIVWPDVPLPQSIASTREEVKAAFISDLHFGSRHFIKEAAEHFLKLLEGDETIRYVLIAGDIVDGVGVYPEQEKELEIKDIYNQFRAFEEWVLRFPKRVQVIVSPGNHDAVREEEPQPPIPEEFVPRLSREENVYLVSNPALVSLHSCDGSAGVRVLIYHGNSFPALIDAIPELRQKGMARPETLLKELMKRRHLAPTYGSTAISPEADDWLVIDRVPDIVHTGNLHAHCVENYKGITLINSSTFQAQTPFMDRVGMIGTPARVTIINLKTRHVETRDVI